MNQLCRRKSVSLDHPSLCIFCLLTNALHRIFIYGELQCGSQVFSSACDTQSCDVKLTSYPVIGTETATSPWSLLRYFSRVWFGLCCLMTPGLSQDIQCHGWPYFFLNLQFTRSDIWPHIKLAVSLVITCGHFNLPEGFVWVCMG